MVIDRIPRKRVNKSNNKIREKKRLRKRARVES
jgi:hypothetical protein